MEVSMIQYYVLNSIDFICQFSFKSYRFGPTWVNDDKNYIFFYLKIWELWVGPVRNNLATNQNTLATTS